MQTRRLVLCLIILLWFGGVAVVGAGANAQYVLTASDTVDIPEQTFTWEGNRFRVTEVVRVDAGSSFPLEVTAPEGTAYSVFLYDNDNRAVGANRSTGSGEVTFSAESLDAGTYVATLRIDGKFVKILPVVVEGYQVSIAAPNAAEVGEDVTVEVETAKIDSESAAPSEITIVVSDGQIHREFEATETSDGGYRATFVLESPGTYLVYAGARGDEKVYGEKELLGLSDDVRLSVSRETPTPSATPTPTPTETPDPTVEPTPSSTPTPTEAPDPTTDPTPSSTPTPTETPDPPDETPEDEPPKRGIGTNATEWTPAIDSGTRISEDRRLTLDYRVVVDDNFRWSDPAESPFAWDVTGDTSGTFRTNPDAGYVVLSPDPDVADGFVILDTNYYVHFSEHGAWELDFVVESSVPSTRNVQEVFFINSPLFENYFVLYDMGGGSSNPDNADDACGADESTPYNKDQLTYRHRDDDVQCWDGFEDRLVDWSTPSHGELQVDLDEGRITASVNGTRQADLLAAENQSMPPNSSYAPMIKARYRGDDTDFILHRVRLQKVGVYQSTGDVSGIVDAGRHVNWTGVDVDGDIPNGTAYDVAFATNTSGSWTDVESIETLESRYVRYTLTLRTSNESATPAISTVRLTYENSTDGVPVGAPDGDVPRNIETIEELEGGDEEMSTPDLRNAITRWVHGDVSTDLLRNAIREWVRDG